MAEVWMVKSPSGSLVPAFEDDLEKLRKIRAGASVRCEISQPRNPGFHRRFFALIKFLFDIWSETLPPMQYKGQEVQPSIDRFRKDLTILAGRYTAHYNIRGECRLEADSISFASMSQEEFEKLYSEIINVALRKVINRPDLDEDSIRRLVDQLMSYD